MEAQQVKSNVGCCHPPLISVVTLLKEHRRLHSSKWVVQDQTRAAWALARLGCLDAARLMDGLLLHLKVDEMKVRQDSGALSITKLSSIRVH